jgi:hypothetical protein
MPRTYTPRPRPNAWTPSQRGLLVSLKAAGRPWPEFALRTGHTKASCQTMLSYIRNGRVKENGGIAIAAQKAMPPRLVAPIPLAPEPVLPPTGRHRRMSTLIADAELRARIEVLGTTGGLLGDPLPGRSALDKMRSGERDDPRAPSLAGSVSA